LMKKS